MSEKPHTVAIGAFVIGAILIAITIVIFALGSGFGQQREKMVMVFDGSVKGLVVGAPVTLRGVQIGQVTHLELRLNADNIELILVVEAEINEKNIRRLGTNPDDVTDQLIARGLRAQLKTQSLLTGLLYIQLDFHPEKPPVFVDLESEYVQIPTIPTDLEILARKLEDIDLAKFADKVESTMNGLNSFLTSKDFQALPATLQSTLAAITELSEQLQAQVAITGPKLDGVLDSTAVTVAGANKELPKFSELAQKNLDVLNQAVGAFEQTMLNIDSLVEPGSATAYQLNKTLRELGLASEAIKQLANTLDQQPESLLRGKRENTQ
jgi:paraquat-inducible protein B